MGQRQDIVGEICGCIYFSRMTFRPVIGIRTRSGCTPCGDRHVVVQTVLVVVDCVLKCDGTRAKTIFRLSAKRTSPFKSAGASVQSTTGSRGLCISGSNAGYTIFRDSVKSTGYPLHSPVSPSLPLPCVTVCHRISTGLCH